MISLEIPGRGKLEIENVIFDMNGTIATDGKVPADIWEKIILLVKKVKVYILTADTHGTAQTKIRNGRAECLRIFGEEDAEKKREFLQSIGPSQTIVVGNGNNDLLILKEAAVGIAVMGEEGLSAAAMMNADVIVKNAAHALDLLLIPKRLIATLRE